MVRKNRGDDLEALRAALKRPALEEALAAVGPGDVLAVWKLDRLGRSLPHLLQLVERLKGQGPGSAR